MRALSSQADFEPTKGLAVTTREVAFKAGYFRNLLAFLLEHRQLRPESVDVGRGCSRFMGGTQSLVIVPPV